MDNFKAELDDKLKSGIITEYSNFKTFLFKFSIIVLQQRKKIVCINNSPFMIKTVRKAIMHRSRLKNERNDKIGKIIRSKEIFALTFFVKLKHNTLKI